MLRKFPRMSGYGYTYSSKAIRVEDATPFIWSQRWLLQTIPWIFSLGGTAGTRAPHIWVQHDGRRISTLDLFGTAFVLLAGAEGDKWCEAASKVADATGLDLLAYSAGSAGDLVCATGSWESAAWVSPSGALLVRPDGFVAWRAWKQPRDIQRKITQALMQALCREG